MTDQDGGAISKEIKLTKAEAATFKTREQRDAWKAGLDAWAKTWLLRGYRIEVRTDEGPGDVVWTAVPK